MFLKSWLEKNKVAELMSIFSKTVNDFEPLGQTVTHQVFCLILLLKMMDLKYLPAQQVVKAIRILSTMGIESAAHSINNSDIIYSWNLDFSLCEVFMTDPS